MREHTSRLRLAALAVMAVAALSPLTGCASLLDRAAQASQSDYRKVSSQEPVKLTQQEYDVLLETNAYRKAHGMSELKPDARLTAIARIRSRDMAARNYFSHVTPEGGDVFSLMRAKSVRFWAAGENLARNTYDLKKAPEVAMKGWIKSPGHRANLLHPAFGHIGIGVAVAKDGEKYLTQVFTD